ncbi:hypothetical protein [Brevibacillus antibioticus]|uniref:hypothetical protein n=1 Tax=Brevibacillus antibioticus TaxID=2570228 RepID=UPI001FCCBA23|nr:hypothetical protein [Brevibacillus antibioticus]
MAQITIGTSSSSLRGGKLKTQAKSFTELFTDLQKEVDKLLKQMGNMLGGVAVFREAYSGQYRYYFVRHDDLVGGNGGGGGNHRRSDNGNEGTGNVPESIPTLKKVDWNEYKRVDDYKPTFIDEFQEKEYKAALKDYDDSRSVGMTDMTDIEQVAKNTGMTIEEIRAMKQHKATHIKILVRIKKIVMIVVQTLLVHMM